MCAVAWRAPDLVVPVVGFRQWRLLGTSLHSLWSEVQWLSAELRAECAVGAHDATDVPAKGCSCGIYAFYGPCPCTASALTPDLVGGVVILWGSVELHATGMRAAHARIVGLELPLSHGRKRRTVIDVADRLGVRAVTHRALRMVGAEQGAPLQHSLRPRRDWVAPGTGQPIGVVPRATMLAQGGREVLPTFCKRRRDQ
ncbi:MAG TPA: hypothetical protein VMB27_00380 [Solirubrobacteraceae bacterium]|nr:hypothetical protein [Solirubrobacteraceae bacterium]